MQPGLIVDNYKCYAKCSRTDRIEMNKTVVQQSIPNSSTVKCTK